MKIAALIIIIILAATAGCKENANSHNLDINTTTAPMSKSAFTWQEFNQGLQSAISQKKPVLVDFYADWCTYCKLMEKTLFSDSQIQEKLAKEYVTIKLYMDRPYKNKLKYKGYDLTPEEFGASVGLRGLPSLVFLNKKGEVVTLIPGVLTKDTFIPLLDYMTAECYTKNIEFDDYMSGKKKCR